MRVLLISSNLSSEFCSIPSHGAIALSAYLKLHGHQVHVSNIESKIDLFRLKRTFREFSPEVIGVSINITEARHIPTFVAMAQKWDSRVPILLGGHYPTLPENS